jgi:hypothetical protein
VPLPARVGYRVAPSTAGTTFVHHVNVSQSTYPRLVRLSPIGAPLGCAKRARFCARAHASGPAFGGSFWQFPMPLRIRPLEPNRAAAQGRHPKRRQATPNLHVSHRSHSPTSSSWCPTIEHLGWKRSSSSIEDKPLPTTVVATTGGAARGKGGGGPSGGLRRARTGHQ